MNYYLYETGCKLNQSLMNRLAGDYEAKGFKRTSSPGDAELILMASCVVTSKAQNEFMRIYRKLRKENPFARIEISGCLSNPDELMHDSEFVSQESILEIKNPSSFRTRPEVVIQTGCDRFCSYCIVPYMRGAESSRSLNDIMRDIGYFMEKGAKEIVLTGVHIGRYSRETMNLAKLIKKIKETQIKRVRLSSLDLSEIDEELIGEIERDRTVARFIHIPLQHTEEEVLSLMKRRHSKKEIFEKTERLSKIEGMRLGADIIYDFPSESDADFDRLADSLRALPMSHFHFFSYSKRKTTLASYLEKQKPTEKNKLLILKEISALKKLEFAEKSFGSKDEIIIEKIKENFAFGKSSSYFSCRLNSKNVRCGDMVSARYKSFDGKEMECET